MKIRFSNLNRAAKGGFGLTESLVGIVIMGMVFVALYAGMATGFQSVRAARENLRATQLLLEKFETLRLYNWDQITTNGFLPSTFTNRYAPSQSSKGVEYVGVVTVTTNMPAGMTEPYIEDMRMVTIRLQWGSSGIPRTRTFTNFVAKYGLQTYIVQ